MQNHAVPVIEQTSEVAECLGRLAVLKQQLRPISTYRLQLNRSFRFRDARQLVSYLHELGVSTCYSSPILQARPGSAHGYDITDHNAINPETGTQEELDELASELKRHGMGLLLDVVPNHMGVGYGTNPWWQDVLQNGRCSKFAHFFDIEWNPLRPELHNKVLLPILGNQYGEELESGKLALKYDGDFRIEYYDKTLPIDPQTIPLIFEPLGDLIALVGEELGREFMALLVGFAELSAHDTPELDRAVGRQREAPFLRQRLRELVERKPEIRDLADAALRRINGQPGDARSFDAFHKLLEAQAYRLAHWRVSAEEINYRRFFDINDLVGLRMEDPQVFAATEALIRRLLAAGTATGLRIDHPDGLFNPPQFFARLQMLYAASQCYGPEPRQPQAENGIELEIQNAFSQGIGERAPLYVAVEKILELGEELPQDWPVDGTVGYDFGHLVNGIFIDTANRKAFTNFYQRFLGQWMDVESVIYQSKKLIMNVALSSEVNVLSHMLDEISSLDRRARDFTRSVLRDAIRETIACFPVYRTYIDERGNISERDRGHINAAIARAKRRNSGMPGSVFEFLRDILLLRGDSGGTPIYGYRRQLYFTLKFQQFTGPVMAKGLEDTACYIYNPFVSVNEVGGSPREFGVELDDFHRGNLQRLQNWPYSMLATSTHDSKRSEDVRMRLDVLSEIPRPWAAQALRWRRANRSKKRSLSDGRVVPDANEEYLLYQTLVGTWPLPGAPASPPDALGSVGGGTQGVRGEYAGDHPGSGATTTAEAKSEFAGTSGNGNRPAVLSWSLDREQRKEFTGRIQAYMTKAISEAKVNMSWINPNQEYIAALHAFIARILTPGSAGRPNRFLRQIEAFIPKIALFGAINSISQALIKLASPGVPDIYQGQELFDFSLVDPDNRRPVDFELRRRYLRELAARSRQPQQLQQLCQEMLRNWSDGRLKLWVTHRALQARQQYRELFQLGSYIPLKIAGQNARHVVAFARTSGQQMAITVTPRFALSMMGGEERMPLGEAWGDAELALPPANPSAQPGQEASAPGTPAVHPSVPTAGTPGAPARFRNLLTGEVVETGVQGGLLCREIFASLPCALLLR
jgi:(1->4)-alpha-D-glucan 1-alpha-D-glucosylmutase